MLKSSLMTAAALMLALGMLPAVSAQSTPPPQNGPDHAAAPTISGELISVDAETKSLIVKTADGAEVTFQYDDRTEVTGARDGAAGLATMANSRVLVQYTEEETSKVKLATRIIVQPPQ